MKVGSSNGFRASPSQRVKERYFVPSESHTVSKGDYSPSLRSQIPGGLSRLQVTMVTVGEALWDVFLYADGEHGCTSFHLDDCYP